MAGPPSRPKGRGGTDFRPGFEWLAEQGIRPGVCLYFTDMECSRYPEAEPSFSVVWVNWSDPPEDRNREAAGGQVLRDLFADEHENGVWLEDPALLDTLAMAKLRAAADELATRWKWAVPMIETAWGDTASYGRVDPQPGMPTDEEKAEIDRPSARHDELVNMDDDEWTEALVEEAAGIEARLDEIEGAVEARATFRRGDFSVAGCIATVGGDGALQVIAGPPARREHAGQAPHVGRRCRPDRPRARRRAGSSRPRRLERDFLGQVVGRVLRRVLHRGIDLEHDDALGPDLRRDLAQLGPERRQRRHGQRARGVDDRRCAT